MSYVDGYLVPVRDAERDAYRKMAVEAAAIFREFGATAVCECWSDDVPDGTSFPLAVKLEPGASGVFSWVVWPSKEVRDAGNDRLMQDPRMPPPDPLPFDAQRMMWGGFETIVEA